MDIIKKYVKYTIILTFLLFIIASIVNLTRYTINKPKPTIISNYMDKDDINDAIYAFNIAKDDLNVDGKVTAKIKKRTDVSLISEYIGESNLTDQRYTFYKYIIQINLTDVIILSEQEFQSIKIGDIIRFKRTDGIDILYINGTLYSNSK